MKFDPERMALQFGSREEAEKFHEDLTALIRTATVAATGGVPVEQATQQARAVMKSYGVAFRALNALRTFLPRHAPGSEPDEDAPGED